MARRGRKWIKRTNLKYFLDENSKRELKEEIKEELRKELKEEELNLNFYKDDTEEKSEKPLEEKPNPEKKKKRRYVRVLVFLIIIILVLDLFSLYFYYKPDFSFIGSITSKVSSGFSGLATKKCKDGTVYNSCSKDKPYYCYEGELMKKAASCGCPSGYNIAFQDCKKI